MGARTRQNRKTWIPAAVRVGTQALSTGAGLVQNWRDARYKVRKIKLSNKNGKSTTKATVTKKKKGKSGNIQDPHFHSTHFSRSRKMSKSISLQLKLMRPITQSINLSGSASGASGLQSAFIPRMEMTFTTLAPAFTMIPNAINTNIPITGLPVSTGVTNTSGGLSLLTQSAQLTYVNGTSALTFATLYDCVCKRDYIPGLVPSLITPLDFWEGGILNTIGEGKVGTGNNRDLIGLNPQMSPLFNQYFKVEKKLSVHIAPGEIYTHNIRIKHNRQITEDRMNKSTWYAGLTRFTMIKMHGQPVTATGVIVPTVSTSQTKLDWIYTKRFSFTSMAKPDKQQYIYNTLTNISGTGEKIETDGDLASIKFT